MQALFAVRLPACALALSAVLAAQALPAGVTPEALELDEKERDSREKLGEIVAALGLKPGMRVADIGAGYGYYAMRLAPVVGAAGRVYAVEIDRPLFERLRRRIRTGGRFGNVQAVLGKPDDPRLPRASLDAVLLADVFHEVKNPPALLERIRASLKPGGRLVVIEYLKPELRRETRARQSRKHNLAPEFVEQDLRSAGFSVTQRVDPLGPGYDGIPMYYVLATAQ